MDIKINTDGLQKVIKALKARPPIARVGILGSGNRTAGTQTNAEIGARHEFGTDGMPVRSFLRVPIAEYLEKRLETSGAFTPETMNKVMEQKSLTPWVKKMAVVAEGIVADAFDSGGFGQWKPSNMRSKKVKQTLVETQQLRNSITSDVQEQT